MTSWQCSNRRCGGKVKQTADGFNRIEAHTHASKPGLDLGSQMKTEVECSNKYWFKHSQASEATVYNTNQDINS